MNDARGLIAAALRKRVENGGHHLHHRDCIHNLPPEEQIAIRGRTVEWWMRIIGPLPEQISPDQWETDPPAPESPATAPTPPHPTHEAHHTPGGAQHDRQ